MDERLSVLVLKISIKYLKNHMNRAKILSFISIIQHNTKVLMQVFSFCSPLLQKSIQASYHFMLDNFSFPQKLSKQK